MLFNCSFQHFSAYHIAKIIANILIIISTPTLIGYGD